MAIPVLPFDDIVRRAVARAAGTLSYRSGRRSEASLDAAVRDALRSEEPLRVIDGTPVYRLPGWTRAPGGVDVMADLGQPGRGRIGIELKVGKPEESLWDAIKLADVQVFAPVVRSGYLISDADWSPGAEGSGLFASNAVRVEACRALIARWPRAWTHTMIGGRGIRPRTSVGALRLAWVIEAPLAHHRGRRLVAVRVEPDREAAPERYDAEGFPVGFEPPDGLRARVQRADRATRAPARAPRPGAAHAPTPEDAADPCHGYPWYRRWSQPRLVAVLDSLGDDPAARMCLRRRLMDERGWTEAELRARFDPFPR